MHRNETAAVNKKGNEMFSLMEKFGRRLDRLEGGLKGVDAKVDAVKMEVAGAKLSLEKVVHPAKRAKTM